MPKSDPTLSAAQRADAACDSFEQAWRAGRNPRVEDYVATAPDTEQDALRSALQKVEAELRSARGTGETSHGASAERTGSHHAKPTPSSPDGTPTHIGKFEVRGVLGAGAFGRVYRAFDPTLEREVAIKVPQPGTLQTDDDRARFLREARAAATVSHPNVCQIFEVGTHDGEPYIVMAMVPGQSLQQALRGRTEPLPERQAAIIARKIALALDAAHKKGVVHRDLKPANVMFDKERKDFVVMDFGLARRSEGGDVRATRSGAVMGTPAYMSPEQARGEARDVGPETDIFSLGVMLYEMLAGVRPFAGSSAHEVMGRILLMEPQPPAELRPGLDPLLTAACLKALAKDPAQRFGTMGEFAAALDAFLYRPAAPGAETVRPTETKGTEGRSETESQHLGNVFARMTDEEEDEDEDATEATRQPKGGKRATGGKRPSPRWPVAVGAALALLLVAVAGVVFFTRSGSVEVAAKLKDVDLNDTTLKFFLDNEPVAADVLKQPMELKPGKYSFEARRGEVIVHRYWLKVEGRRRPSIEVEDAPPKPDQTRAQAPPKPVPPVVPPPAPKEPENAEVNKQHPPAFYETPWTLAGDELVSNPQAKYGAVFFGSPEWEEYDLSFKVKMVGDKGYTTARFHLTGVHPTVHSYRGLQFGGYGNEAKDLLNVLNGRWDGRDGGGYVRPGLKLDRWYDVIIVVRGQNALVVFDNQKIFDVTNDKYKKGRLGFDHGEKADVRIRDVEVKDPKGKVLWKGVSQLGVAKKEPDPVAVAPKKEPEPAPAVPSADPFQPGSVWTSTDGPERKLTVVERTGETFRATFEVGPTISRDVTGVVKDGKVSWLTKDVRPTRGGPGGDNVGALVRRDGKDAIDFEWKDPGGASGKFTLVLTGGPKPAADGFVPLFNGKDLTGWTVESGPADQWKVEDGHIKGQTTQRGAMGWLLTDKEYTNYELKLQFQIAPEGDGAIGLRGRAGEQVLGKAHRLAIKLTRYADATKPQLGDFYYGRALWQPAKPPAKLGADLAWHAINVTVQGDDVAVSINGALVQQTRLSNFADKPGAFPALKWASGRIGLQLFDGEVRYRNIEIKELPPAPAGNATDGFVPLFNGKDLTGWVAESGDTANWKVENGAISVNVTEANRKETWLLSEKSYKDFVARFEFKAEGGTTNSGFALRGVPGERPPIGPNGAPFAVPTHLQVELFSAPKLTGSLLTIVTPPQQMAKSDPAGKQKPDGEWNEVEVEVRGQNLKVRLNGAAVLDCNLDDQVKQGSKFPGLKRAEGRIGFQRWGGAAGFRNIRVKELTPAAGDGFVPLFGKDLTGWDGLPGAWTLQNGSLVGNLPAGRNQHTFLCSRAQYGDFEMTFDVRMKNGAGNSGLQVRSAVTDAKELVVTGPQVEIDAALGGLYGERTKEGWLKQAPENTVRQAFKPNDFNSYTVRVVGKRVVITLNGTTLTDDTFPTMADRGIIAFQLHGRMKTEDLTFRNVQIRDLSAPKK